MRQASTELTKRVVEAAAPGAWLWDGGTRGVSGFGLRVSHGGTKAFIFRYRVAGKQSVVTLGRFPALTVEQGRELARQKAHEVASGGDPKIARRALRSAPTVSDLAEHYLGAYAASQRLRASTVRDARDVLRYVLPSLGKCRVAEVGGDDIRRALALVQSTCEGNAKRTAKERREAATSAVNAETAVRLELERGRKAGRRVGTLERIQEARQREATRDTALAEKAEAWVASGRVGIHQANRLRAVLSVMFGLAIERGDRGDNPCLSIKKQREEQRWRHLSENEVSRLFGACERLMAEPGSLSDDERPRTDLGSANRWGVRAILLLLYTGARLREVLRAEWSHFDLEAGVWLKPSAHTKTNRQHRVDLPAIGLELLRDMHASARHRRFLFPESPRRGQTGAGTGGLPFVATKPRADLNAVWRAVEEEAGLSDTRLHDLRRTLASLMLSDGHSLATVGKQLGHTQASTTQRYAHLHDTVQRQAIESVGERFRALGSAKVSSSVVPLSRRR